MKKNFLIILELCLLLVSQIFLACSAATYTEIDLINALYKSDYKIMKNSLKAGITPDLKVKVNLGNDRLNQIGKLTDEYECYLLHLAILRNDYKALKLIKKYGASTTNKDTFDNTPLHLAIKLKNYGLILPTN